MVEVAMLETQAYPTQTIFYSSAALVKDGVYTILSGDTTDTLQEITTITAITER